LDARLGGNVQPIRGPLREYKALVVAGIEWIGDDARDDVPFVREMHGCTVVIMPRNNFTDLGLQRR
jgi:hypothetical protein